MEHQQIHLKILFYNRITRTLFLYWIRSIRIVGKTIIRYQLPHMAMVELTIYNILGERIRTLLNEVRKSGIYTATWNGRDEIGNKVVRGSLSLRPKSWRVKCREEIVTSAVIGICPSLPDYQRPKGLKCL